MPDPVGSEKPRDVVLLRAAAEDRLMWSEHDQCWWLWPCLIGEVNVYEIDKLPADALDSLAAQDLILLREAPRRIWVSDRSKERLLEMSTLEAVERERDAALSSQRAGEPTDEMIEALKFYAQPGLYCFEPPFSPPLIADDKGKRARAALDAARQPKGEQ